MGDPSSSRVTNLLTHALCYTLGAKPNDTVWKTLQALWITLRECVHGAQCGRKRFGPAAVKNAVAILSGRFCKANYRCS